VSFTIIKIAYKENYSNTVLKVVKSKFIDGKGDYVLESDDSYMTRVSPDIYDDVKIGDKYQDFWLR
jgi:hypothetical protein